MVDTPNEEAIKKQYQEKVKEFTPKPPALKNVAWAFVVGGIICLIGQFVQDYFMSMELSKKDAGACTTILMVFLGSFLTGIGVYDEIGKRAGAGSIVPITGFANSVVSCAMEFKREGFVFGIGAKMFIIAGPVIVYGLVTSCIVGIFRWINRFW